MPSIPLVARETANSLSNNNCSGGPSMMSHRGSHIRLSAEEETAAEESLSAYCKPVELYNIIHHRGVEKPLYLQRCMRYKLEEKHKNRIQLTVSLYVTLDHGSRIESLLPLHVMLAKSVSNSSISKQSARYRFKRCFTLSTCTGDEGTSRFTGKFFLPEGNKLSAEIESGSLAILFISCAGGGHMDFASYEPQRGLCLLGKTLMEILDLSCGRSPSFRDGSETLLSVDLRPCVIETSYEDHEKFVSLQAAPPLSTTASMQRLDVIFIAENLGAKYQLPPEMNSYNAIASSSLPHITRLRNEDVVFHYMYYNNKLQRTEVTADFSCPFCLVKCASFKGLKCHLLSSHDLFKFEFRTKEGYQAVHVNVKESEIVADGVDIKAKPWSFRSKPRRRTNPKSIVTPSENQAQQPRALAPDVSVVAYANVLEPDLHVSTTNGRNGLDSTNSANSESVHGGSPDRISGRESQVSVYANPRSAIALPRSNITTVTANQVSESVGYGMSNQTPIRTSQAIITPSSNIVESTAPLPGSGAMAAASLQLAIVPRRTPVDHDARIQALVLQRRPFYHSHRAQPMEMEEILAGWDSEDEIDHDIADMQDRRMLDDFVDVTNDEKQLMHMWNSFVRRQRVLADYHIPWACEYFSRLHAAYFAQTPSMLWCWRIFMIKLWKHGLLNDLTIDNCNLIIKQQSPIQQNNNNNNNTLLIQNHENNAAE